MVDQDRIMAVLRRVSPKGVPADPEESLFDSGYLDSFALTDLVSGLEQEFGFEIPDADLNPRKFDSISRIQSYLESR